MNDPPIKHELRCAFLLFLTAAVCALAFFLLLGKDYFLVPTLMSCLVALLILRGPIERKEGLRDE